MSENSSSMIAESVIRALDDPNLSAVAGAAHEMVKRESSFDQAVATYRRLLDDVNGVWEDPKKRV